MISERCHHRPVYFSILDASAVNEVLAQRVLSLMIQIKIEAGSVLNIVKASAVMSLFVGGYRLLVHVVLAGVAYGFLVLRFDGMIYEGMKGIMLYMNVRWAEWL